MSCSAAGLNRIVEQGDRDASLDISAASGGGSNSVFVDECALRLSECPAGATVSESSHTKAGPARVPRSFRTSGGMAAAAAAAAIRNSPRCPPCLFRGSPETGRDGDDSYPSFHQFPTKCTTGRSRPRAKLTRSKAVTAMHLELSPSLDYCQCCALSAGGFQCAHQNQCFATSPSASFSAPLSPGAGNSATVPHLSNPEDGEVLGGFPYFQKEEFFGLVATSQKHVAQKPGHQEHYCEDLGSLGLFLQQHLLAHQDSGIDGIVEEAVQDGSLDSNHIPLERPVKEVCAASSPVEESPIAALFEADEQLKMAPDVGSSCSDLSVMTSSSPTLSTFTSNRSSARSSFTSRRSKRSLSISPSSTDGMDLNTIIRSSPTSLVAYLNGSRCSSSTSISSAPGAYGHLSARPTSPRPSGVGLLPSTPYSPTILKLATRDDSAVNNPVLTLQAIDEGVPFRSGAREFDFLDPEDNLAVVKQQEGRQDLAASADCDFGENVVDSTQPLTSVSSLLDLQKPPPPSYDQHMARKLAFHKMYSSDSSQPSNYSSFESTGSADASAELAEVDSTTTEPGPRSYDCQWIDCRGLFQDQESLVRHIEACHIDQRVRDEYTCFWQGCPRRHRPFNARYKLLIHMRVHSGEKPNRCTFEGCGKAFSRLENLKIHLRSHTGERPYSCQFPGCPKAFSNSSDRAKHQRTHQDTKPYACQVPECCKRYTDPSSLRKHYKNHAAKEDTVRKKIRSENDMDVSNAADCLDVPPAYSTRERPKLEHADSGIGRSPGASSASECCYPVAGRKALQLSLSDNDISCRSTPYMPYTTRPGLAEFKLHPREYSIPPFRPNSFTESGETRTPTKTATLEVPRSDICAMSFGGFHPCSTTSLLDWDTPGVMGLTRDDLEPLMTLNMADLHVLGQLGDSLSSREDSADESLPSNEQRNCQTLPHFDAFYTCLDDLPHFGGVS